MATVRRYDFELTGTTPLLMHRDSIEGCDLLSEWRKDKANRNSSVAGDDRSPPWSWQTYLYEDGEKLVMPFENLMASIRKAAATMILKKQKTFKEISQSGIRSAVEYFDFYSAGKPVLLEHIHALKDKPFAEQAEGVKKYGFTLFCKRATINGKSKNIRVRPRFNSWGVKGTLHIVADEITGDRLQELLSAAGDVGLGDWRPGCKTPGVYGIFSAKVKLAK